MKKIFILPLLFINIKILNATPISNYEYKLGVGINVNWAVFSRLIKNYNSSYIKPFADEGFKTIRLRFDFTKKVLKNFHYSKVEYVKFLKRIVTDCEKYNLNVVLANGASKFKQNPNEATLRELINNWVLISTSFKNLSYKVSFNLITEPGKNLNKNSYLLNKFYKQAYHSLRLIDKYRILIWGPNHRSNPRYLFNTWYPYNDNYIIAEWHMFAAGPKENYKKEAKRKIKIAYNWSLKYDIPTWVGAWMPGNYNKGDSYSIKEQLEFSKFMLDSLREKDIPFAINADTQFFNYKKREWNNRKRVIDYIVDYF